MRNRCLNGSDMLATLGHPVLISNYGEFHRLASYLFRFTKQPVGLVMGIPTLRELFEEKYYADLAGGILESFGRLFKNDLKLYVYPLREAKTGALITAGMAIEYGRQVFAVPGRIDSPRSKGCHDLIKKGAKLCEGVEDILSEFEYLFPTSNRPPGVAETGVLPAITLSENEQKLFDLLKADDETSIDDIIRHSGLPSSAVSVGLLSLEMKRLVKQLPGKLFVKNR